MKQKVSLLFIALALLCFATPGLAQQWAGTYTTNIGDADVPPEMKPLVGRWQLVLSDESPFTLSKNGEVAVRGSYVVSADQITFSDSEGPMACPAQEPGSYGIALDGATLTLTLTDDNCAGRRIVLTSYPLTKEASAN